VPEATEKWKVRFTTETRRNTEKNNVSLTISVHLRALRVSVVNLTRRVAQSARRKAWILATSARMTTNDRYAA
jgi:hypothetical protein